MEAVDAQYPQAHVDDSPICLMLMFHSCVKLPEGI